MEPEIDFELLTSHEAARMAVDHAAIIAEAWGDHYPTEVFPEPGDTTELDAAALSHAMLVAAWAMRHASKMIAAQIRDGILDDDEEVD